METELVKTSCPISAGLTVDVLFVGSRTLAPELADRLNQNGYLWTIVQLSSFAAYLRDHPCGTIVLDGEFISVNQIAAYQSLFQELDKKSVALIIFNCPPALQLYHLQLAFEIDSVEFAALWAHIESSVRFSRRLRKVVNAQSLSDGQINSDTAQQLEMAARVQRNFLPQRLPNTENLRWSAVFRPAEWVSGDMYDIARLDEDHIGFYLADAVGHSVPAALLTMFLKQATVMRQTSGDKYFIYKPCDVIKNLNLRMVEQELNGCLFATCVYALLNIRTLKLEYARAGHPYPVLIRDQQLIPLQTRGGLLGVFETAEFEQHSLQLQPGDKLFIYSDGGEPLIGQNNEDGSLQFFDSFRRLAALPIDEMLKAYAQQAADFRFAPGQIDDVSAVGLEIL